MTPDSSDHAWYTFFWAGSAFSTPASDTAANRPAAAPIVRRACIGRASSRPEIHREARTTTSDPISSHSGITAKTKRYSLCDCREWDSNTSAMSPSRSP